MNKVYLLFLIIGLAFISSCEDEPNTSSSSSAPTKSTKSINLDLKEANRLSELPHSAVFRRHFPCKSGVVIAEESDMVMTYLEYKKI